MRVFDKIYLLETSGLGFFFKRKFADKFQNSYISMQRIKCTEQNSMQWIPARKFSIFKKPDLAQGFPVWNEFSHIEIHRMETKNKGPAAELDSLQKKPDQKISCNCPFNKKWKELSKYCQLILCTLFVKFPILKTQNTQRKETRKKGARQEEELGR